MTYQMYFVNCIEKDYDLYFLLIEFYNSRELETIQWQHLFLKT